ncbi:MAG: primosomal protein N' [Planctomycetota bacterium]|nr:MAG: primosomal protein N' [Planctomycetota bacterium]
MFDTAGNAEPAPWERTAREDVWIAEVVVDRPLDTVFHYRVPDPLRDLVGPGHRVRVPFGRGDRPVTGFCVAARFAKPDELNQPLKSIDALLDREPLLDPEMLALTRWIADRYLCPWGQVLQSVVPAGVKRRAGTRVVRCFALADAGRRALAEDRPLPPKQRRVLEAVAAAEAPLSIAELTERADCGTAPIDALRKKGFLQTIDERRTVIDKTAPPCPGVEPAPPPTDDQLTDDQRRAIQAIRQCIERTEHTTFLLQGVTGSGKTEVYIRAIQHAVSFGRQAIVLVPEISLTPQTIRRFQARFTSVAVLHSHLSDVERHRQWQRIREGRVQVVVGARSAIFAPTPRLGLIVIDEEHETTFKQETAPRYHAREVAEQRARTAGVPLVLGTATPALETWWRTQPDTPRERRIRLLKLRHRVAGRPLPPVRVVDVRNDHRILQGHAIGRVLQTAIERSLRAGGQVILFLNLRGYAPTVWCRRCGQPVRCPHCDIGVTYHKDRRAVLCHFCEFHAPPPRECPGCGAPGLRLVGTGTQRLEEEVRTLFGPDSCRRMDSDTMRRPGSHDAALADFQRGAFPILLGTQMIAKGLDFPRVTLVGVIDADSLLRHTDPRASERTFQLITQVAGRTGRGDHPGRVLVQTRMPDNPAIQAAIHHDFDRFARQEIEHRRAYGYPPFAQLARIVLRGPREQDVAAAADELASLLQRHTGTASQMTVLGPSPAPVTRLRSLYRYQMIIKHHDLAALRANWKRVAAGFRPPAQVEWTIDVDPLDFR